MQIQRQRGKFNVAPEQVTYNLSFLLEIIMSNKVPFSKSNDEAQEKLLLEPFAYLMQFPGKDVRVKLLHAFNVWLQVDETKVREIGKCLYVKFLFVRW